MFEEDPNKVEKIWAMVLAQFSLALVVVALAPSVVLVCRDSVPVRLEFTMAVTLQLTPEQERRLEEGTARHDEDAVRQVLIQVVDATVPRLMNRSERLLDSAAFGAVLDDVAALSADTPSLSEAAVSRSGIYSDHP